MSDPMSELKDIAGQQSGVVQPPRPEEKKAVQARRRRLVPMAIQEVVAIGVGAKYDESQEGWVLEGFYKAKGLLIKYDEAQQSGVAIPLSNKRIQGSVIKSFDDLVELNYAWWNVSRKENVDYEIPEDGWKEEFIEKEMVERKMLYIPKASSFNPGRQNG
jgi:hypothetical protein